MVDRIQHRIDQEVFQGISSSLPHIHKTQPTLSNELHKQLLQHQCLADKVASIPTRTYSGCYIVDESRRLLGTLFFFASGPVSNSEEEEGRHTQHRALHRGRLVPSSLSSARRSQQRRYCRQTAARSRRRSCPRQS